MTGLTAEGRRVAEVVAARHGVSPESAETLLLALQASGGSQAQFSIPELGGMGQWSRGGMLMIGDMFNNALKARVDALVTDLASELAPGLFAESGGTGWWPDGLGIPSATGAQNNVRYAYFPSARRLAVSAGGSVRVYDTGSQALTGFSQQQIGDGSLAFLSAQGLVPVDAAKPEQFAATAAEAPAATSSVGQDDVLTKIERLAEFRDRGILSEEEFTTKKLELLARL